VGSNLTSRLIHVSVLSSCSSRLFIIILSIIGCLADRACSALAAPSQSQLKPYLE
jgi:hypothetical protein